MGASFEVVGGRRAFWLHVMFSAFAVYCGCFKVTVWSVHSSLLGASVLASGSSRHFEGKLMSSMEGSIATLLDLFSGGLFGNSVGRSLGNLFEGSL